MNIGRHLGSGSGLIGPLWSDTPAPKLSPLREVSLRAAPSWLFHQTWINPVIPVRNPYTRPDWRYEPEKRFKWARSRVRRMRLFRYEVGADPQRGRAKLDDQRAMFRKQYGPAPLVGTDIVVSDAFERLPFVSRGKTLGLADEFELPEGVVLFPTIDEDGVPKIIARCPDPETAAFLVLSL